MDKIEQKAPQTANIMGNLVTDDLVEIFDNMDGLPSLPAIYKELMDAINSDNASLASIGDIIARDISMSTEILRLVNSSFYGIKSEIISPQMAVSMLGMITISALVLNVHIFSEIDPTVRRRFRLLELWSHSINTARVAQLIAREEGMDRKVGELAYIGGLLHDVGKVVLATKLGDRYQQAINIARLKKIPILAAERRVFNTDHAAIGGYLLNKWDLPDEIVRIVAFHHAPTLAGPDKHDALPLVHTANHIEEQSKSARSAYPKEESIDMGYLATLGMESRVKPWIEMSKGA
jgi:putative nucleotidyltransferase with HDIG domain